MIIWDGTPIHRSHVSTEFLATGAKYRLPVECLRAYAPELNPGEGLWAQLKGVELRQVCCFSLAHLCQELRHAVKRGRRKSRLIKAVCRFTVATGFRDLPDVAGLVLGGPSETIPLRGTGRRG